MVRRREGRRGSGDKNAVLRRELWSELRRRGGKGLARQARERGREVEKGRTRLFIVEFFHQHERSLVIQW